MKFIKLKKITFIVFVTVMFLIMFSIDLIKVVDDIKYNYLDFVLVFLF